MSDSLVLHVSTNRVGSECTEELGYTKEEWAALTIREQDNIVHEVMLNVANIWITGED